MADAEQKIGIVVTAKDEATPELKKTQKTLQDFSETAFRAAEQLSATFGKKNIDQAQKMANVLRSFNQNNKIDTKGGLDSLLNAKEIKDVGSALAQLTGTQASSIMGMIDEPTAELEDLSDTALLAATHLSAVFSKDQINKAKELARAIRSFNQGLEQNTKKGLGETMNAQTVEELGQAFANLSSTEMSALSGLYEKPQKKLSLLEQTFNRFSKRSEKSLHSLKRFLDRIGNIIMYRLIRQGLSLMVSQVQEGTKAVYMWSRAFNEIDENRIAQNLDMIATKLDNIRGNLGAAWGTILTNFSGTIEGFLNKISDGVEKITAFASALNGSATYARVAEKNVKRYYEAVTNGLQGITVIGRQTQMEDALIPNDILSFAKDIKREMGDLGTLAGGLSAGIGLMLIATGHVVAGLALGGAALGIYDATNQLDDASSTSDKVKQVFQNIGGILPSIELGLGLALISGGKMNVGIPLVLKGGSGMFKELGNVDLNSDLSEAFSGISLAIDTISLGLGAILCAYGNPKLGVPLLLTGLTGLTEATITNWDDVMGAFQELGQNIQIWWWNLWHGDMYSPWEDQVKAFAEAHMDQLPTGDTLINSSTNQLPDLDKYLPPSSSLAPELPTETQTTLDKVKDFFGNVGDIISHGLSNAFKGYMLRYGLGGLDKYADGGFPSAGSLFLAGEVPGQTELLGTINGKTGVAGGAEITGIREAIYEVGAEIIASMRSNNVNVTLEGDADGIFNIVRQKASDYTRATGNLAF